MNSSFAPLAVRIGLFVVFLLFGLQKLKNPGQSTAEIQLLLNWNIINAAALNYYLGLIEILLAILFLVGFKTRIAAFTASLLLTVFFLSFLVKYGLLKKPKLFSGIGPFGGGGFFFLAGRGPFELR